MKDEIRDLVNYVIEAMKDYRQDQSAETYRLSRINQETNPASDAPETTAKKFAKINADYKEEKRLERAPRGPQTRKKPVDEDAQWDADAKKSKERTKAWRENPDNKPGGKYYIGPPVTPEQESLKWDADAKKSKERTKAWREHPDNKPGGKYYIGPPKVEEGAQVPKGAKTGPVATGYELKAKQTKDPSGKKPTTPAPSAFSKSDWAARKAAMDKAIDG